ncbi:MAG: hypothetical protein [Bacteriophage sp.]|nr:MAG: hypothetical protein [Bacteriophage sp.]
MFINGIQSANHPTENEELLLFLDADGCISTARNEIVGMRYDIVALKMIEQLQRKHKFKIVLISERRKNYQELRALQAELQVQYAVNLIFHSDWKIAHSVTRLPNLPVGWETYINHYEEQMGIKIEHGFGNIKHWRGFIIQDWLNRNISQHENVRYLVVDDSADTFPIAPNNTIHVKLGEERGGIQLQHYDAIDEYFTANTESSSGDFPDDTRPQSEATNTSMG